jgi:hypothetical protein
MASPLRFLSRFVLFTRLTLIWSSPALHSRDAEGVSLHAVLTMRRLFIPPPASVSLLARAALECAFVPPALKQGDTTPVSLQGVH